MNEDAATVPTPQRAAEAVVEQEAKNKRRATAFLNLFGREGKRGEDQKIVLEHLRICGGGGANAFQFSATADGASIALSAAHRDGAKSLLRIIHRQISLAVVPSREVAKTKIKR